MKRNCEAIKLWTTKHFCVSQNLILLTPSNFSCSNLQTRSLRVSLPLHPRYKNNRMLRYADCGCKAIQKQALKPPPTMMSTGSSNEQSGTSPQPGPSPTVSLC